MSVGRTNTIEDPDITYIDGAPYVTARIVAKRLGYSDPRIMLTLGGMCESFIGWNPIPPKPEGADMSRVDLAIPVYGAIQLVKHSKTDSQKEVMAWLERVLKGKK